MDIRGKIIGNRYQILDILGKGGMSEVYYAKDLTLEKKMWALKKVSYKNIKDEFSRRQLEAFEKEVELLTTLNHPDIPRIVDRIRIDDDLYVCMDLIDGVSLKEEMERDKNTISEDKIIDWALNLCDILIYLHEAKEYPIVYRDLKVENVMLANGRIKLIDFGIAQECERGVPVTNCMGTKGYAAPEQYTSSPLDERTDIYTLGAMLYFLAIRELPDVNPYKFPLLRTKDSKYSEGLEYIIHKCIQEKPENRYQNCHELKRDIENIEMLNSDYKQRMKGRLIKFASSFVVFCLLLVMTSVGYSGVAQGNRDNYLYHISEALIYQQNNEFELAETNFIEATKYRPKSAEPYLYLLDMYQLKEGNREELIKESILTVERLVEDKNSGVYNNPEIIYRMAKLCFEVKSDVNYAVKAYNYFERVKKSNVYEDAEIDSYLTISYYNKMIFNNEEDYVKLADSLQTLEAYTDGMNDINKRLDNYFTLTTIYNTYLNESLLNSKDRIIEITDKALDLVANTSAELLEFTDEITLLERSATAYYTRGVNEVDLEQKRSDLNSALDYFLLLEDMGIELTETLNLRIGNIYRGLYETYDIAQRNSVSHYLTKASSRYEKILESNNQNMEASIKLTDTYLDLALLNDGVEGRDFSKVISQFNKTQVISDIVKNSSFRALKQRLASYGL